MNIVEMIKRESREEGRKIAQELADSVNTFGSEMEEAFAEKVVFETHRTLQQGIMRLFMATIKRWAEVKKSGLYDARNEATVELASKIMEAVGGKWWLPTI